jgi:CelD/BcsL family acetyltransferase involved in cellulose biosynthesis
LFAAKLSKDTRKKLRKKETKLATLGPIAHIVARTPDERRRIIDAFIAQKVERFTAQRIGSEFGTTEMRTFIERASAGPDIGIELHALTVGERIVAVYGGGAHAGNWSGMFNAFDTDETIARSSPGDLLMMRIIAKACAEGLKQFDLGIGEARYKAALCDERLDLFDAFVPVGASGRLLAGAIALRFGLKRRIKNDPRLYALAKRLIGRAA